MLRQHRVEWIVLAVGVVLRIYLALVNAEANDDHLPVVAIIAEEHRMPRLREAWEGFQPKLYHTVVAVLWKLSPWESWPVRVRIAQFVSCAAGILTLLVLRRGLAQLPLTPAARLMTFALVSVNPALIGLSAQATNDSFVILFSTVALICALTVFRDGRAWPFVVMAASAALATISQGNGLVVVAAIVAAVVLLIVRSGSIGALSRARSVSYAAAFVIVVLASAAVLGSYRANWEDTGNPFAINGERAPRPSLLEETYVYRPGVTSIAHAYLTFRLADMLRYPVTTNGIDDYPRHRTSLWSQVYGRAHVAHFSQHPPSWKNTTAVVLMLTRAILLAALVPTVLLVRGMTRQAFWVARRSQRSGAQPQVPEAVLTLAAWGSLAFLVLYSMSYRDFATMKAEFLFPAVLAFAWLFGSELDRVHARTANLRGWRHVVPALCVALACLYIADVVILAAQLT